MLFATIENLGLIAWLSLTTTLCVINTIVIYKLIKKLDDNMMVVSDSIEIFNDQLTRNAKEVESMKRSVRMVNNEVKENRRAENKRII